MTLSTIIVAWNAEDYIGKCLESLQKYGPDDQQIIVAVNKSSDRTLEIVQEASNTGSYHIDIVPLPKNYGLGTATAIAYRLVTKSTDLVLMTNPDIIFNETIKIVIEYAEHHPEADAILPSLRSDPHGSYHGARHFRKLPFFLGFTSGSFLNRYFRQVLTRYYLSGPRVSAAYGSRENDSHAYGASCMLFRKEAVDRMDGLYSPEYFYVYADADLGNRMAKAKVRQVNLPDAWVYHFGGYSSKKLSPDPTWREYLMGNGQSQFEKDWGHQNKNFLLWLADTVFLILLSRLRYTQSVANRIAFLKGWVSA